MGIPGNLVAGKRTNLVHINKVLHNLFFKLFKFKWRNPFITASKILFRGSTPKRVLGIWDFENGRAVIGDAIAFHEILLVIAEEKQLDRIDICFIKPQLRNLKKNIYQITDTALIDDIISLNKINPRLGSYYVFDDNDQFSMVFHSIKNNYITFPNPFIPFSTVSNWYHLTDFYEKYKYIPNLKSDEHSLKWAYEFLRKYCQNKVPITVAMRNNNRDDDRNAPIANWIIFFDFCAIKCPQFKFIVIGTKEEIVPELLDRDNVIFAKKEANSTLLQDMALIEASKAVLVHNSGVAAFSWFIKKPTLVFGVDKKHLHFGHALSSDNNVPYNFLSEEQRVLWGEYTKEDIIGNFQKYIVKLDHHYETR